jgi:hypothetical protein
MHTSMRMMEPAHIDSLNPIHLARNIYIDNSFNEPLKQRPAEQILKYYFQVKRRARDSKKGVCWPGLQIVVQ